MKDYQYLDRIVIESLKELAKPPIVSRYTDNEHDYFDFGSPLLISTTSTVNLSDINLAHWKVTMHYKDTERFARLAAILGREKAEEVLKDIDGKAI